MDDPASTPTSFLTPQEVASILRISATTFERLFARGELPFYRFGHQRRIKRSDLEVWIEARRDDGWRSRVSAK